MGQGLLLEGLFRAHHSYSRQGSLLLTPTGEVRRGHSPKARSRSQWVRRGPWEFRRAGTHAPSPRTLTALCSRPAPQLAHSGARGKLRFERFQVISLYVPTRNTRRVLNVRCVPSAMRGLCLVSLHPNMILTDREGRLRCMRCRGLPSGHTAALRLDAKTVWSPSPFSSS